MAQAISLAELPPGGIPVSFFRFTCTSNRNLTGPISINYTRSLIPAEIGMIFALSTALDFHLKSSTMKPGIKGLVFAIACIGLINLFSSCSRSQKNSDSTTTSHLQVRLTDSPFPNAKEVWVDILQVEIIEGDSSHPLVLNGAHPGLYNLLNFTNGKDTLLADATIPAGTISQIRLILGDNNYIVTSDNEKIALKTPSGQESGLKVQVHQDVTGGILYRLILDFDAGRSVVKAGNSGNYLLKPVLRIISFIPSGGDIQGVVVPDSVRTAIFAIAGIDTVASTFTDTTNGGYLIKDIPAGNYSLVFIPSDTSYKTASTNATVVLGQITTVDTVRLTK